MHYKISYSNPLTHFLEIEALARGVDGPYLDLKLPIWRPGRYEAAYYAKNVQRLQAFSLQDRPMEVTKISPSTWRIVTGGENEVKIKYRYYAHQMDAGGSFLDEHLLYINFVNCMVYTEKLVDSPCEVYLDIPSHYKIACGLQQPGNSLIADSYHQLVDSPLIASESLQHYNYTAGGSTFHLWIEGEHPMEMNRVISQFEKFTETQIRTMGEFPAKEYHFLFLLLPYRFYHGVEHHTSTVICIGPSNELNKEALYQNFLGVSSHELFHAWNVMKIRPKELMPFDFNAPTIFPTGFVAEGFTTYYGDLFLKRSGVFSLEQYLEELKRLLERHFMNFGRLNNSLVDSSIDLWMDGYQPSAPHKKSSIYVEGAVVALLLDLQTRVTSHYTKSLDDVIRMLWTGFGKTGKGYALEDICDLCEKAAGSSMKGFFTHHIEGSQDTRGLLQEYLAHFGLQLSFEDRSNRLERTLGIKLLEKEEGLEIILIEPGSAGEQHLSVRDIITSINKTPAKEWVEQSHTIRELDIQVIRNFQSKQVQLSIDDGNSFLKVPKVTPMAPLSSEQAERLGSWLGG